MLNNRFGLVVLLLVVHSKFRFHGLLKASNSASKKRMFGCFGVVQIVFVTIDIHNVERLFS